MASKERRVKRQSIIYGGELFPSEGIRKWYKRELSALSTDMSRKTIADIIKVYRRENENIKALYAQDADSAEVLKAELDRLNKEFYAVFTGKAEGLAKGFVARQEDYANISVKSSLKSFGLINGEKSNFEINFINNFYSWADRRAAKAAIEANVNLIKSINSQFFEEIAGLVFRSVINAEGITSLKEGLSKISGKLDKRIDLIASDQTKKVYEALSRAKLAEVGVSKYEWVYTYGSKKPQWERVYHRDVLAGQILDLAVPVVVDPKTGEKGYPGTLINCHCIKRPVIVFD
ncbi:MAG: hypothetical protein ACI352_01265 [Elusimicrobiaceae bacterium]